MHMKKVLFVATIYKHIMAFHLPYIKWFKEHDYEVHIAAKGSDSVVVPNADKQFEVCVERNPFNTKNIKAIKQLRDLVMQEKYCLVTCHTAMGGVITRLACKKARHQIGLKVLYTAHGFHFFKGSPKKYWLMYYPMEKYLSRYTDAIITINQEDYELVKTHKFRNLQTYKIHGIGINTSRLFSVTEAKKQELREEYGYSKDDFILLYIAEHIPRKNHKFLIESMQKLVQQIPNVKLLFAGRGEFLESNKQYAHELNVDKYIDILGFRKDIGNFIAIADIGVSASKQEGLPVNIMEEMYMGRPAVASKIRGHVDLIDGTNGLMFTQNNHDEFIKQVVYMYNNLDERKKMGERAIETIQEFKLENSLKEMEDIYFTYLPDKRGVENQI